MLFFVAISFLISLSVFSYVRINSLVKSAEWVNHTSLVKFALQEFYSDILSAESAQRGYIISKDNQYTQQYNQTVNEINHAMGRLSELVDDNYSQQTNLTEHRILFSKRNSDMERSMGFPNVSMLDKAGHLQSRATMLELHQQIKKMMNEEDSLLRIRKRTLGKDSAFTPLLTFLVILASILVLSGSYYFILKELQVSNKLRLEILEKNKHLETMNAEMESFTYISSHDLHEPLRKIQMFNTRIIDKEKSSISGQSLEFMTRVKAQFRQLMTNLISNSLKFVAIDVQPKIEIENTTVQGISVPNEAADPKVFYSRIFVKDNGIGFDERYRKKIFEVFQRLHSQEEYIGTGIGLAIVKKIMVNHSGFISADSPANAGAIFTMYFPMVMNS